MLVGGVLLRLTDTAGIRNSADRIEAMGVERSRQAAQRAALALLVLDGSQTLTDEDEQAMAAAEQTPRLLVLVNKSDLPQKLDTAALAERFPRVLHISAQTGAGLDALAETVAALYPAGETPAGELLTNARQADAVERALSAVAEARGALDMGVTPDVVLTDAGKGTCAGETVVGFPLRVQSPARRRSSFAPQKNCHHKIKGHTTCVLLFCGDPYRIRTDVKGVRGLCLNHLTNGPLVRLQGLEPGTH